MKPIQPILTFILVFTFIVFYGRLRKFRFERILLSGTVILGITLIIVPQWASFMARMVGITRGVDLIIYLGLLALMFMSLLYSSKIRELEFKVTELTRYLAILSAETPSQGSEGDEMPQKSDESK